MNNVLVPIDGSAAALRAMEHAVQGLRGRPDARVHALNVQAPKIHTWPGKLVSPDRISIVIVGDAAKFVDKLKAIRPDAQVVPAAQLDLASASGGAR